MGIGRFTVVINNGHHRNPGKNKFPAKIRGLLRRRPAA